MTLNELAKEAALKAADTIEAIVSSTGSTVFKGEDTVLNIILTAIEASWKDLELENQQLQKQISDMDKSGWATSYAQKLVELDNQNQQLSAAVKASNHELRFLLNELEECQSLDDEIKLQRLAELHRRLPGFNALSTTPHNALRELLAPTLELLDDIYNSLEGFIDGAPDASARSKVANELCNQVQRESDRLKELSK